MTERPIPKAELRRACRKLCRRVAAALVQGMADTDTDFDTIDARLGKKPGAAKALLDRLLDGRTIKLDQISDFALAMDCELSFRIERRPEATDATAPKE